MKIAYLKVLIICFFLVLSLKSIGQNKISYSLSIPTRFPIGQHTCQQVAIDESINLTFLKENPYYYPPTGIEVGVSYHPIEKLGIGIQAGIIGSLYEEYNYERWEYRNLIMMPIYGQIKYQFSAISKAKLFIQTGAGYNLVRQNFYGPGNLVSIREKGGIMIIGELGISKELFNHDFFLSVGYEYCENNLTLFVENMPLSWVGTNTGTRSFKEFKQQVIFRIGMYL